jgi:enoyl-CoA hydratase/carnithine racemase
VVLNRPAALNALTIELLTRLDDRLVAVSENVNVVVISGAGGNFSAGGDRDEVARLRQEGPDAPRRLFAEFRRTCALVQGLPVPVIAAVEGYAVAGGFELMQACDVAVVSSNASIADIHSNFGQIPAGGGSQRLPRLVGHHRALGLMLTGDRLSGEDAVAWGLAYECAPAEEFDAAVEALAERIAAKPREVLRRTKQLVHQGLALPLERGLDLELKVVLEHHAEERGDEHGMGRERKSGLAI